MNNEGILHLHYIYIVLTENETETWPVVRVADTRLYQDDWVNEDPISEKQHNDMMVNRLNLERV